MSIHKSTDPAIEITVATTMAVPQRKRPLRTYGRRSLQTREHEQNESTAAEGSDQGSSSSSETKRPVLPQTLPARNQCDRSKRGSILAYFKPLPPSSETAASTRPSDSAEPVSTPPSSPPPSPRMRKRRRLTTRPQFCGGDQQLKDTVREGTQVGDEPADNAIAHSSSPSIAESTIVVNTDGYDNFSSALSDVAVNVLPCRNGQNETTDPVQNGGTKSKPRREKRRAKEMTQTTLSLSVHKEPGFTICGVCDLLYNPLNEKDRREHRRRHAAYSRAKAKSE